MSSRQRRPAPTRSRSRFDQTGNRELPDITAQLTILPKHYWEGTDANGKKRDILSRQRLSRHWALDLIGLTRSNPARRSPSIRVEDLLGAKTCRSSRAGYNFDEIQIRLLSATRTVACWKPSKADQFDVQGREFGEELGHRLRSFPLSRSRSTSSPKVWQDLEPASRWQAFRVQHPPAKIRRCSRVRLARSTTRSILNGRTRIIFFGQYTRVDSFFAGFGSSPQLTFQKVLSWKSSRHVARARFRRRFSPGGPFKQPDGFNDQKARSARTCAPRSACSRKRAGSIKDRKVLVNAEDRRADCTVEFLLFTTGLSERIVLPYIAQVSSGSA